MSIEPSSFLTLNRPDIWMRAISLATRTTGMTYLPKVSGELVACGYRPPDPKPEDWIHENPDLLCTKCGHKISQHMGYANNTRCAILDCYCGEFTQEKQWSGEKATQCFVPDGEMEWLLHEVGHWVASTPAERLLQNYGYNDGILLNGLGKAREWQAWGFEDIVLSPFGTSRLFASPSQCTGVAFNASGPIPNFALRHAEKQIKAANIDIQEWREIYAEWITWKKLH